MTGSHASVSPESGVPSGRGLLISPSWIGDVILSLPAIRQYRREYPDQRLDVLAKPAVLPLWRLCPDVHDVIPLASGNRGVLSASRRLRAAGYTDAWILPNSWRSALIPWLAGIPRRMGYAGHARRFFLTRCLPNPSPDLHRHQSRQMLDLLCPGFTGDAPSPDLHVPESARTAIRQALADYPAPFLTLIPGAARGSSKRWPPERFAEVGRILRREWGGTVLVSGAPSEADLCAEVARQAGGLNWAAKTSPVEWAALLQGSDIVICNDSGGMHLAAVLGTPGVALFGRTDPAVTGPLHPAMRVLQAPADGPVSRRIARDDPRARLALDAIAVADVVRAAGDGLTASGRHRIL